MKRATIAGGGIAGMAAALGLARAGWQVTVCEEAAVISEVGAGLQTSPNAAKVLRWLGVLDPVAATGFRPKVAEMRDGRTGARIFSAPLGDRAEARWGAPYLHLHRADLLDALTVAAQAAGAELRTGEKATGYVLRPEGPALKLESGPALEADLLIGADGIRSVIRAQVNGPEAPEFSGQVAWRGTIRADRLPAGLVAPNATVWGGTGRHLVTYYLRGGKLVNFVAVVERGAWTAEGWSTQGDPDELRQSFQGWHPDVTRLLEHVDSTFLWGLFGRPEQVRWADGPVALIGDAAHPMLPFMGQGAAMALEDVAVLVHALQGHDSVADAVLAYEQHRWPRVTRVQHRSRENGRFFHRRGGGGLTANWQLVSAVSALMPGFAARQLDWLYGHDATEGLG
ncbi:MAG TPA: FAD-dependent monooxygenase [Thermohalobaculum sp.]|nr:FAD-dependent monooxygenase [Thermohalobaculum sp.]